jgi:hypothetical protein
MAHIKRKLTQLSTIEKQPDTKRARQNRKNLITTQKIKKEHNDDENAKRINQDEVYDNSTDLSPSYLLLTPRIGIEKRLTCGPSLVRKAPFGRKFSLKHSVKMPAVGSAPSFGRRAVLRLEEEAFGDT